MKVLIVESCHHAQLCDALADAATAPEPSGDAARAGLSLINLRTRLGIYS